MLPSFKLTAFHITDSPHADLFNCSTLLVAWADIIKVARIQARPHQNNDASTANLPPLLVEITAVFRLDSMVTGIVRLVPDPTPISSLEGALKAFSSKSKGVKQWLTSPTPITPTGPTTLTSFLVITYTPPETFVNKMTNGARQARKAAEHPELRIISRAGEELTADTLTLANYQSLSPPSINSAGFSNVI